MRVLGNQVYSSQKNIARLIIAQKEILEEGATYLDSTKLDWIYILIHLVDNVCYFHFFLLSL